MAEKVFGIDLGTTYSVIATLDNNAKPEVFELYSEEDRKIASAVYFQPDETGQQPHFQIVGKEAKKMAASEPDRVVQFVKREIGKEDVRYSFDGVDYDPITVSSLILKRMKQEVEEQGYPVSKAVITCPAYFGNAEKTATRQAGEIAGLEVLDIIHEPTAAALNYCSHEFSENRRIMVYDLGGGTFDVTLLDFSVDEFGGNAQIVILDSTGDDRLGGVDWDKMMETYISELYADENGISTKDIDARTTALIKAQSEENKKRLSLLPTLSINVGTTRITITAEEFRERTKTLVERTTTFVSQLLGKNGLSADDIDTVLLVGGSTRMPMVQDAVKAMFPEKDSGSLRVRVEDPDYAVAKGAAIAAGMKYIEKFKERTEEVDTNGGGGDDDTVRGLIEAFGEGGTIEVADILSRSFGPAVLVPAPGAPGGKELMIDNLLFIGGPSPAEAEETYKVAEDNLPELTVPVFENISKDERYVTPPFNKKGEPQATDPTLKVKHLGTVILPLPAGTPKGAPILIRFKCGSDGLTVYATNVTTGETAEASLRSEFLKTREQVESDKKLIGRINTSGTVQG
ncbi:MAG: Hsp70 family protein [Synergistaceae bacterium]|nr:Hsp70 family protein [Synergistaceae bacterium]